MESVNDLWGIMATMTFDTDVVVEAYAVPALNATLHNLEQI